MLKKIIIEGFRIYGDEKINSKAKNIDFKNGKVIMIGENGTGKTSFLNLIVGIMLNENSWYQHIRYKKITFHFDDGDIKTVKSNYLIQKIEDVEDMQNKNFNESILMSLENIKISWETFKKWIFIFEEKHNKEILKIFKKDLKKVKFDDFFIKINRCLEKSDSNLKKNLRINEMNQVINCQNYKPVDFINGLVANMKKSINIINSIKLSSNFNIQNSINKINQRMYDNFEYFSIFRRASEFIKKDKKNSDDINLENKKIIYFELSKDNFMDIIKDFLEEWNTKIIHFKNNFFQIVANNKWIDNDLAIKNLEKNICKISKSFKDIKIDADIINLCSNLKNNKKYKKRISGYISKIPHEEIENIFNLFEKIKIFIKKMNEVFINKKLIFEAGKLYLKKNNEERILINNTNILSAGEKQMFQLLYTFCVTDKKLIIMDEPEISLSIKWQQTLKKVINEFLHQKRVLFVTHSPYLISRDDIENATIINFNENK